MTEDEKRAHDKKQALGTHEVGYCRPPKEGQFKKGQVANPKGRPPKPKPGIEHARQVMRSILEEERTVTVNGVQKKMSYLGVCLQYLLGKPTSTSIRELEKLMTMVEKAYSNVYDGRDLTPVDYLPEIRAKIERMAERAETERKYQAEQAALERDDRADSERS